jgi:dipeptidyl aminopeptidase/acylaminoacyl peptidase
MLHVPHSAQGREASHAASVLTALVLAALILGGLLRAAQAFGAELTLEKIMADPDWIGAPVQDAYWAVDGRSVYYSVKRSASPLVDLHRVDLSDGKDAVVAHDAASTADGPAIHSADGKRAAFVRNGDVFVRDASSKRLTQITRVGQKAAAPQFSADGALLSYRVGTDWFVYETATHLVSPAAVLKAEKDPDAAPAGNDLHDLQLRIFSTLKKLQDDKDLKSKDEEDARRKDPTRARAPFYLGDELTIRDTELSPNGRWMLVVTAAKSADKGRKGKLTRYVTDSGYEEFEDERLRVGRNSAPTQSLLLLDLADHSAHALSIEALPGIHDDPLKAIREENAKLASGAATATAKAPADGEAAKEAAGKPRSVVVVGEEGEDARRANVAWSRDGTTLAIEIFSNDNKDRWIVSVDFTKFALVPQHRLTDSAWVEGRFSDIGWLNDNRTLWYLSEESGFSQLYTKELTGDARALTQGRFEVSNPVLAADGRWFYLRSNTEAPYAYDVFRVPSGGGKFERVTRLQGVNAFELSPDGNELLITHSSSYVPPQIAVARADGTGAAREFTDTRTAEYKALEWIKPEIVRVPSTHFDGAIYAKVYKPAQLDESKRRPGVLFVHGAGYTQNVHLRYPYYFREQMFNNLLVQQGYVVIDMDYRASEGYGRDWRTAIYRQMGHKELEDLLDGKRWLVEHAAADPKRFGIYGGSYGGFMTLMALFRAPGEFAAGAAVRPVTDWMQYNPEYTSEILNDPQIDPIAYARSSPIEFAAGLQDALLICHGVIDDNVLFEDSMRLYQRLIELHKDNFTISPYPLDRHAFSNADSWLDEYKRIDRLFQSTLQGT